MKFMMRSLMGLFLLAITVGILALAAGSVRTSLNERWASESKSRPARERVFSVNVLTVEPVTAHPKISTFGEIHSRRALDLRAPVAGTILELSPNFAEGGQVAKGELLMRLDPADAQSALNVVVIERAEAAAELAEAKAALLLANDELEAAHQQVSLRKAALKRQQNLLNREVGTEAAVETAALASASANQAVLGKRQALAQAEARINRAGTAVSRSDIRFADAERRLKNTEVFAEFSGILSDAPVVQGGLVSTNEKIGRIIDPSALEVVFRISSAQFARLIKANNGTVKGEVKIEFDQFGEEFSIIGNIERVSAEVGEGQTGRKIFAVLPVEASRIFKSGDFVSVEVAEPVIPNAAVLPASALDASGQLLVIGENDRLETIEVQTILKQGDIVIANGTVIFGREVVAVRTPVLGAGIRVIPLREGAAPTNGSKLIELTPERRDKLMKFVENNSRMPSDVRKQILGKLKKDRVPAEMVNRIESRMGG